MSYENDIPVTIRYATRHDAFALLQLAQLDDRPEPSHPVLVAEVAGAMVAARSLEADEVVADPFVRTEAIVRLLDLRAAQIRGHWRARRSPSGLALPRLRSWRAAMAARRS
jgi:hypothetical protein